MRKSKEHSVMIKNLCMHIRIDTERERERERERDRHKRVVIFQEATITK